jgi:hypothetical protein
MLRHLNLYLFDMKMTGMRVSVSIIDRCPFCFIQSLASAQPYINSLLRLLLRLKPMTAELERPAVLRDGPHELI